MSIEPTLGFDTKHAAILHLFDTGVPVPIIARDLDITENNVRVQLSRAGRSTRRDATFRTGVGLQFLALPKDLVVALRPYAARRNLSCTALAALLLDTVIADGLVDATLDDREA